MAKFNRHNICPTQGVTDEAGHDTCPQIGIPSETVEVTELGRSTGATTPKSST